MVRWIFVTALAIFLLFGNYNTQNLQQAVFYYGEKLSPTYPLLGTAIFIFVIIVLIITDNLLKRKNKKI